ncbi:MAG: hypothetical protein ACTSYV_00300 [Candidatus Heimdallarchaeaceae archaeon]
MRYIKLTSKVWEIIALEGFVFGSFLAICAIINALIVYIPNVPETPYLNFFYALSKVVLSLLFVLIWLVIWFYLTKRLMNPHKKRKQKITLSRD